MLDTPNVVAGSDKGMFGAVVMPDKRGMLAGLKVVGSDADGALFYRVFCAPGDRLLDERWCGCMLWECEGGYAYRAVSSGVTLRDAVAEYNFRVSRGYGTVLGGYSPAGWLSEKVRGSLDGLLSCPQCGGGPVLFRAADDGVAGVQDKWMLAHKYCLKKEGSDGYLAGVYVVETAPGIPQLLRRWRRSMAFRCEAMGGLKGYGWQLASYTEVVGGLKEG